MRKSILFLFLSIFFFSSCVTEEGVGGTGSVDGVIYHVIHPDGEYKFTTDTFPAAEMRVYIQYGNDRLYSDDMRAGHDGYFQFKYLTKGTYTVFAYNEYQNGKKEAVTETITIGKGENKSVNDIYIHSGKMYGKYYIKGQVKAKYYKSNGTLVKPETPIIGERVYIRKTGIDQPFDDVRTGLDGNFIFEKITPGDYEIYAVSEISDDRHTEIDPDGRVEITIAENEEENTTEIGTLVIRKRA